MTYRTIPHEWIEGRALSLPRVMLTLFTACVTIGLLLLAAVSYGACVGPIQPYARCTSPGYDGAGCCPPTTLRCLSGTCRPAIRSTTEMSPCMIGQYGDCAPRLNLWCGPDRYCHKLRF